MLRQICKYLFKIFHKHSDKDNMICSFHLLSWVLFIWYRLEYGSTPKSIYLGPPKCPPMWPYLISLGLMYIFHNTIAIYYVILQKQSDILHHLTLHGKKLESRDLMFHRSFLCISSPTGGLQWIGPTFYCLELTWEIEGPQSEVRNYRKIINLFTNQRFLYYSMPVLRSEFLYPPQIHVNNPDPMWCSLVELWEVIRSWLIKETTDGCHVPPG